MRQLTTHLIAFCLILGSVTAQVRLSPSGALATLKAGNQRYASGVSLPRPLGEGVRRTLARGQSPVAIVVTCADSRVSPEHVFNAGLGELFVIRTAGNVCDPETLASIEHAAVQLGTPLCVIMGHTHCGAVKSAATGVAKTRALGTLMERIHPAIRLARIDGLAGRDMLRRAERENAYLTISEALRRSKALGRLVRERRLVMRAAHYHLETGKVEWLPERRDESVWPRDHEKDYKAHTRGMPPHVALSMLRAGHHRYLSQDRGTGDISHDRRAELVAGQHPMAIVVTCADSRVPPEHIFDAGLGELFVIRVAGNVANDQVVASIEYAVGMGAGLCLVLGHEGCGAVATAIKHGHDPHLSPSMRQLLEKIEPSVERARGMVGHGEDLLPTAIEQNTLHFLDHVRQRSKLLRHLEGNGTFTMVPAIYLLKTGDIRWLKDTGSHARDDHAHGEAHGEPHSDPHATGKHGHGEHGHAHDDHEGALAHPARAVETLGHIPAEHTAAAENDNQLLFTLAIAALITIGCLMTLLFWQRRGAAEANG